MILSVQLVTRTCTQAPLITNSVLILESAIRVAAPGEVQDHKTNSRSNLAGIGGFDVGQLHCGPSTEERPVSVAESRRSTGTGWAGVADVAAPRLGRGSTAEPTEDRTAEMVFVRDHNVGTGGKPAVRGLL